MIGKFGRSRRSHRKICRLSASPRGRSKRSRSGVTPAWTYSNASQPLPTVSSCQELDSPIDQSERTTVGSLLTTRRRTASIAFSITGLKFLWDMPRERENVRIRAVRRRIPEFEPLVTSGLRRSRLPMYCRHSEQAESLRLHLRSPRVLARAVRFEEKDVHSRVFAARSGFEPLRFAIRRLEFPIRERQQT